ncbi:MgtC/SapB family protein [Paenibacillus sp. CMAA1364]
MNNPWIIDDIHIILRLLLAMALGGAIGLERERLNRAAGLRTHILVCLGSTLIMMLSIYGFSDFVNEPNIRIDPARLAASVITGIGFLGAGTILFTGKSITGLTTAASVWVVAALGLCVGAGFYVAAITTTLLILMTLIVFNKIELRYMKGNRVHLLTIHAINNKGILDIISKLLAEENLTVKKIIVNEYMKDNHQEFGLHQHVLELSLHLISKTNLESMELVSKIGNLEGVTMISLE